MSVCQFYVLVYWRRAYNLDGTGDIIMFRFPIATIAKEKVNWPSVVWCGIVPSPVYVVLQ